MSCVVTKPSTRRMRRAASVGCASGKPLSCHATTASGGAPPCTARVDRNEHGDELVWRFGFLPGRILDVPALTLQPHVSLLVAALATRVAVPAHTRGFDGEHRLGPRDVEVRGA